MLGRIKRGEQNCQTAHPREILRHRSHSFQIIIAHHLYRDPTKYPRHSSLPGMSDPSQRSSRQSIPIGHALGNGLVQPIFRPPSRRPLLVCFPKLSRRDAGLKTLCVMWGNLSSRMILFVSFSTLSRSFSRYLMYSLAAQNRACSNAVVDMSRRIRPKARKPRDRAASHF